MRSSRCAPRVARSSPASAPSASPARPSPTPGDSPTSCASTGATPTPAWTTAGFDATEIGLLSELYWGLPMRTYVRTRAWSRDDLDAAEERLTGRGLVADGAFTDAGRRARGAVESATDAACAPIVAALGDDLDELIGILGPWGAAIREAAGYPAGGPHDLARAASGG